MSQFTVLLHNYVDNLDLCLLQAAVAASLPLLHVEPAASGQAGLALSAGEVHPASGTVHCYRRRGATLSSTTGACPVRTMLPLQLLAGR